MQLPLRGIVTPLVTPLATSNHAEPSLDSLALERLVEHVIGGGVSGIFLLGTTGEFSSLGRELRQEIVRRTCTQVNRRIPVLVNIADTAISETFRLAETAEEAGADALVLTPPFYFQNSQEDLFRYIEKVAARVSRPLFLYNIPHLTKNSFEPETVRRASELPGVVGLKDSTHDPNYLERVLELLRDRPGFSILIGPEEMLLDSMKRGAIGGVCGGSNLFPKLFVDLYNAIVAGNTAHAAELQEKVNRMGNLLYRVGFPGSAYLRGIKAALSLAGLCHAEPAPPFMPFFDDEFVQLEQRYRMFVE
ncbi:MAG TPA: dihydrodipicolinate synthase family protein [Bryobacteraceae bacterium]|nr:dihydrodipicolinate synthase family protein [Bryobacteraceae bacterium]